MSQIDDFLSGKPANTEIDDFLSGGSQPKEQDIASGDYMRGLKSYGPQMKQMWGAGKAIAGKAMGIDSLIESGIGTMKDAKQGLQDIGSKPTDRFSNVQSIGDFADWAQHGLGQVTGNLAETAVAGLAGAALGSAGANPVTAGVGGVTGLVGKSIVKKALKEGAEKIAKEYGEDAAKQYIAKGIAEDSAKKLIGRTVGTNTAIGLDAAYHGLGETGGRAIEEAQYNMDDVDLGRVLPAAASHTAAEFIGNKILLGGMVGDAAYKAAGKGVGALSKSIAGNAALVAGKEVPVEMFQTEGERYAAGLPLTDESAQRELVDTAAQTALFGVAGVPAGVRAHYSKPARIVTDPTTGADVEVKPEAGPLSASLNTVAVDAPSQAQIDAANELDATASQTIDNLDQSFEALDAPTQTGATPDTALPIIGQEPVKQEAKPLYTGENQSSSEKEDLIAKQQAARNKYMSGQKLTEEEERLAELDLGNPDITPAGSKIKPNVEANNGVERVDMAVPQPAEQQSLADQEAEQYVPPVAESAPITVANTASNTVPTPESQTGQGAITARELGITASNTAEQSAPKARKAKAASGGGQVASLPEVTLEHPVQTAPIKAYQKAQATALAARMTKQGLASEAYPHPTEAGKFAIRPAGDVAQAEITPVKAYKKGQANAVAAKATKEGKPSEVYPHPTEKGMFAVREISDNAPASSIPVANKKSGPAIESRDDLIGAIMRVTGGKGIDSGMSNTILGDSARNNPRTLGLFKQGGVMDLDDIANLLSIEEGYYVRDGNHLAELIGQQASGSPVWSMERIEREKAKEAEREHKNNVNARAQALGLKGVGGKRTLAKVEADILAKEREIAALETERERQVANAVADAIEGSDMTEADFMRWLSDRIEYTQEEIDEADTRTSEAEDRRIASYAPDYSEGEAQGGGQVGNGARTTQEGARGTSEKGLSKNKNFLGRGDLEQGGSEYGQWELYDVEKRTKLVEYLDAQNEAKTKLVADMDQAEISFGSGIPIANIFWLKSKKTGDVKPFGIDTAPQAMGIDSGRARKKFDKALSESNNKWIKEELAKYGKSKNGDPLGNLYTNPVSGERVPANITNLREWLIKGQLSREQVAKRLEKYYGKPQDFSLTGQTNEQAAAQHAQKPSDEITKEQIDKERDAVPFSLAQESQPKPVGVQGSLIGANGKPSKQSTNRTEALITEEPNATSDQTAQAVPQQAEQQAQPVPAARPAAIINSPHAQRIAKELPGAQDVQVHSSDSLGSETSSLTSGQMSKWRAKTIERIAKAFGRKSVVFFSAANETADGMMISGTNDPLYININSGIDPLAVVGHEWRHSIKQTNQTAHDAIQAAAKALLAKDDRLIDYAMNYHGSELKNKEVAARIARLIEGKATQEDTDFLAEEFSSDIAGNMWRDPEALRQVFDQILATEKPSKARDIIKAIADAITKLINKLLMSGRKSGFDELGISQQELLDLKQQIQAAMVDSFRADVKARVGAMRESKQSPYRGEKTETWTPDEKLIADAKRFFGTTTRPLEAGYILPDGTMLDFTGRHETSKDNWRYMTDQRSVDHRMLTGENMNGFSLDQHFTESNGSEIMHEFMAKTGAMRVDFRSSVASIMRKPSAKQIALLSKNLDKGEWSAVTYIDAETGRIITEREFDKTTPAAVRLFFETSADKKPAENATLFSPSRHTQPAYDALGDFWLNVAQHNDLFYYQTTDAKTIEQAFEDVVVKKNPPFSLEPITTTNIEEVGKASTESGDKVWAIWDGKNLLGKIHERGNEVWINVAGMTSGSGGGASVYSAVGQYAHNTGKEFIGDPAGFEGTPGARLGEIRRVEHLISQALRYGTTNHVTLGKDHVAEKNWKKGDFRHNLDLLLKESYANYEWLFEANPKLAEIKFDVDSEQFILNGRPVTDIQLRALLGHKTRGISGVSGNVGRGSAGVIRGARIGEAIGVSTAKRAIVAKTILDGMDSSAAGRILDGIDAKLDAKGLAAESGIRRVQYSKVRRVGDTVVIENPTREQARNLLAKSDYKELRGLRDPKSGNLWVWDAARMLHEQAAYGLGLTDDHFSRLRMETDGHGNGLLNIKYLDEGDYPYPIFSGDKGKSENIRFSTARSTSNTVSYFKATPAEQTFFRSGEFGVYLSDFMKDIGLRWFQRPDVSVFDGEIVVPAQDIQVMRKFAEWLMDAPEGRGNIPPQMRDGTFLKALHAAKTDSNIRLSTPRITVDGVERPTTNSNGKPIHPTEEGIRSFWRWFGESAVTDNEGRPLVVYHGTSADVERFDLSFSGSDGVGYDVPAIFATTDQKLANDYALNKFDREIANAMRALQRFKNEKPSVYDDEYERLYQNVKDAFAKQRGEGRPELGGGANVVPMYMRGDMHEVDANGQRFMAVMPKALSDAIAQGKDGVIVNNVIDNASPATEYPSRVFVTFVPENVKSATGNTGEFSSQNSDIRFSPPRFVSQLATQIDKAPKALENAPAAQWRMWINNSTAKLGVKKDEIVWSGVDDYLAMRGKDKVSKAEIAAFLSENGTQVQDVVLASFKTYRQPSDNKIAKHVAAIESAGMEVSNETENGRWGVYDPDGEWYLNTGDAIQIEGNSKALSKHIDAVIEYLNEGEDYSDGAKFAKYVVPGGENYRELLITLPTKEDYSTEIESLREAYITSKSSESEKIKLELIALKEKQRDLNNFKSSHFDQPNILAHLRMDERTDAEGNPTLFLQEIQSDYGQSFKKQKDAINKSVDDDFLGIVERMKRDGVLEVNCD